MIGEIAELFPCFMVFSKGSVKRAGEKLALAGMRVRPEKYLSFSLQVSIISSFLGFLFLLSFLDIGLSLALSLIIFSGLFLLFSRLPSILAERRGAAIESDLPVALRSMAAELGMGIAFEKCLGEIACSQYSISADLRKAADEIEHGGSGVREALLGVSSRVDSMVVKRAVQQMIETYRHGSKGQGLKHLADELIERQKAESKEYNARITFLGLLFIAMSCIVPALFQAYAIVGSTFLSSSFSPSDVWLAYLLGFPAANALILIAIYERTPKSLGKRKEGLLSRKMLALADKALARRRIGIEFKPLLLYLLAFSTALSFLILLGSFVFPYAPWLSLLPFALPLLAYFFIIRAVEVRTSEIEARLPDALLQASSFPKGTPTERIIKEIADSDYGPLSEEFSAAHRQIASGASVPSALNSISEENDSVLLSRACELLARAYSSGGDMHRALKETAEDMFSIFSIVREKESVLALQKYTLLFGGGVLVPLVLGTIASIVSGMDVSGLELVSSVSPAERAGLVAASIGAAQAYLAIYSLLASLFIAQLGGSWRNFAPYFVVLVSASLLFYNLALSMNFFSFA